jgi:hypothetical protein
MFGVKVQSPYVNESRDAKSVYFVSIMEWIAYTYTNGTRTESLKEIYELESCTLDHFYTTK